MPLGNDFQTTETHLVCFWQLLKDQGEDAKKIGIMVASHNEDTVRFAIEKMKEIGISPEDKVICFGQLLGMCDFITMPLGEFRPQRPPKSFLTKTNSVTTFIHSFIHSGQAGYSAYKYIPYGPVQEVLPYLSRRAQENKGVLQKLKKEKRLLRSEILRRLAIGKIFYKPNGKYVPI